MISNCGPGVTTLNKVFTDSLQVTTVPLSFGFNSFYKKYCDANGIPLISSDKVPDSAILAAKKIIVQMLGDLKVPDVVAYLNKYKVRIAVMAIDAYPKPLKKYRNLFLKSVE